MSRTVYKDLEDITDLQKEIMHFVDYWARTEKTPIPKREILDRMALISAKPKTVLKSLIVLAHKGYIRRAHMYSKKSCYVQLRKI